VMATNTITFYINAMPSASVSIAGQDTNQTTVCSGSPAAIEADLSGVTDGMGAMIWWSDGWCQTNFDNGLTIYRTNNIYNIDGSTPTTNRYWLTNLVVTNLSGVLITNDLTADETGIAEIIVDPVLSTPPTNDGDKTSCYNVAVPLSVTVPSGFTADWYSNATLVASGTTNYVPPVPINLGTNSSLTNIYVVYARFIDPNLTNCYSPGANVSLISLLCTNTITSITPSGTNALISWSGNYVLQSATNLIPPVMWTNVFTQAVVGPYTWTNSMVSPPANNFFRLYAPTN